MQNRDNYLFDQIVNKGIATSKFKDKVSAKEMMKRAGIPDSIIERVLFEPQKIRSTDWN